MDENPAGDFSIDAHEDDLVRWKRIDQRLLEHFFDAQNCIVGGANLFERIEPRFVALGWTKTRSDSGDVRKGCAKEQESTS